MQSVTRSAVAVFVIGVLLVFAARPAWAQGAFTYQGRLDVEGAAYTGPAWLQFSLWSAAEGGVLRTTPIVRPNVDVRDGLFTVELDFGVDVLAEESYLQLGVSNSAQGIFVPVLPRQAMRGAPIATVARNAAGWSTRQTASETFAVIGSASGSAVRFSQGTFVTQSFVTPTSGLVTGVWMRARGADGPAQFDLLLQRGTDVVSRSRFSVPQATSSMFFFYFPLAEPVRIEAEEQMRLLVEAIEGTLLVGIISSSVDPYPSGSSSYVNPNFPAHFTDIPLRLDIAQTESVNEQALVISGGSLMLKSDRNASTISISDGPSPTGAGVRLLRGSTLSSFIGKDATGDTVVDVSGGRAMTIAPSREVTLAAGASILGGLSVGQSTSLQALTAAGPATFSGGATLSGGTTINGTATLNGSTSLMGATSVGSIASPSSLGVFGSAEVNTGSLTTVPPVAFRITHANPSLTGWPIRIENPAISGFAGGMRLTSLGFLEVTNRAGSGLSNGFARLDSAGMWSAVSDARLKTAIEGASSEGLLAAAMKVRPVTYFFRDEEARAGDVPHVGVLAQELREVLPNLVRDDGTYMTVNYAQMSVVAIGAIQAQQAHMRDQQARLEAQEATIASQQREIEALRQRLEAIERALGTGGKD